MQPTDALFDAINRGDVAAARDALNRGADMNGVNILGMTPMELSVDLGRNDISFLLLSMRGEDTNRGSRALGRDTPPSAPVSKTAHAAKPAGPGKAAQMANTPVASRPVATPKLFANDGGTPLPSAGFLGFDSRSASN
jgi:ankyrin repeat protein